MTGDRTTSMPTAATPAEMLEVATRAARAAAEVHRTEAGDLDPAEWDVKGRSDFVTEVDREAERRIVEIIHAAFPHDAIQAEEGTGGSAGSDGQPETTTAAAPVRWIVDPLDGTTNWLHGYPEYAVSIAAMDGGGLAAGVVLNSAVDECFDAVRDGGARRNGEPITVSRIRALDLALVGTGFPFKRLEILPAYLETFSTVLRSTSGIRRAGAAALDLCDVACGRLDAFFEFHLMPWDVAAGGLIVREAGGYFEPLPVPGLPVEAGELPAGGYVAGTPAVWEAFRALMPSV
ncbi:MAG: inositol monophosphatase family protein [Gemmatimonadota bacterium]